MMRYIIALCFVFLIAVNSQNSSSSSTGFSSSTSPSSSTSLSSSTSTSTSTSSSSFSPSSSVSTTTATSTQSSTGGDTTGSTNSNATDPASCKGVLKGYNITINETISINITTWNFTEYQKWNWTYICILPIPNCLDLTLFNTSRRVECMYYPITAPSTNTVLCNTSLSYYPVPYAKYDIVPICLVFGGVSKVGFFPLVDDFSMLLLPANTTERNRFDQPEMWIQVETGYYASAPRYRREKINGIASNYVAPFFTAIVQLDNGNVVDITWDDGCYGCSGDQCIQGLTCGAHITNECWVNDYDCSMKVYVGWFGTDRKGNYLTSAGKRLSRFRQYSFSSALNSAAETGAGLIPDPPVFSGTNTDNLDSIKDGIGP